MTGRPGMMDSARLVVASGSNLSPEAIEDLRRAAERLGISLRLDSSPTEHAPRRPDRDSESTTPFAGKQGLLGVSGNGDAAWADLFRRLGHDLRNPLSAMGSALQVLEFQAPGHEASRRRAVEVLERQYERMSRLVEDLQDLTVAIQGYPTPVPRPVALAPVLKEVARRQGGLLRSMGLHFRLDLPASDAWTVGDREQLERALMHLLADAAHRQPEGCVLSLSMSLPEGDEGPVTLRVQVDPPRRSTVTDSQAAGQGPRSRGLHLVLADTFLKMMNGELTQETGPSADSFAIVVRLHNRISGPAPTPVPAAATTTLLANDPAPQRPAQILLVDDDPDFVSSMGSLLDRLGHQVDRARHAEAALDLLACQRYDIVFVDLELAGLDGLSLARLMRTRHPRSFQKLIGMSGYADEIGPRSVFDEFLTKPIPRAALEAVIASLDH